jgi:hypothetical protein
MIAVILHFKDVDVLSNNTLYSLTPPEPGHPAEGIFLNRVSRFNTEQRKIITSFLVLYTHLTPLTLLFDENQTMQRALLFWGRSF